MEGQVRRHPGRGVWKENNKKKFILAFDFSHILYLSLVINRADTLISNCGFLSGEPQSNGSQPEEILPLGEMLGNVWTFLTVTTGRRLLLSPRGQRPEILLNILYGTGTAPQQQMIQPKMSIGPRMRKEPCCRGWSMPGLSKTLNTCPRENKRHITLNICTELIYKTLLVIH